MSLDRHTHRLNRSDMQNQHKMLCKQYKDVKHAKDSKVEYLAIQAWWLLLGVATKKEFRSWMIGWDFVIFDIGNGVVSK